MSGSNTELTLCRLFTEGVSLHMLDLDMPASQADMCVCCTIMQLCVWLSYHTPTQCISLDTPNHPGVVSGVGPYS
eukprot:1575792-Heterocapsa_arctica.AAC.1